MSKAAVEFMWRHAVYRLRVNGRGFYIDKEKGGQRYTWRLPTLEGALLAASCARLQQLSEPFREAVERADNCITEHEQ